MKHFLFDILFNSILLNAVAYAGLILTVYSTFKGRHKKIYYQVLKNKENYALAMWNVCAVPIFREDISDLFFQGVIDSRVTYIYSTDQHIELQLAQCPVIINGVKNGERIRFSFDFMNPNEGYFILICGNEVMKRPATKIGMYGRIRGEDKESFSGYVGKNFRGPIFMNVISIITFIGYVNLYLSITDAGTKNFIIVIMISMAISWVSSIITLKHTVMPWKIRNKLREYEKSGYNYIRRW